MCHGSAILGGCPKERKNNAGQALYDYYAASFADPFHYSTLFAAVTSVLSLLVSHFICFSLLGVILPMVLRSGGTGMLRRSRSGRRYLDPLCTEVTARICDLGGQAAYSGRLQEAIRRGRGSLHRRDCARAEGKASAPFAHIGKSRLGTDGRSLALCGLLLSCLPACSSSRGKCSTWGLSWPENNAPRPSYVPCQTTLPV